MPIPMITCSPIAGGLAEASVVLPVEHVNSERLDEIYSYLGEYLNRRDMEEFACEPIDEGRACKFSLVLNPHTRENARHQLIHLCASLCLIGDVGINVAGLSFYH
jgi:hypothetical protein